MIVSWNWLKEFVKLDMSHDALVDRLTMSGLNHEGSEAVGDDTAIDLEVTSNRPDCLGHFGVAREISVLFDLPLTLSDPKPVTSSESIGDSCEVVIDCPDLCYRYTARLIRGVKIGPSPDWLKQRLETLGIGFVNNVVDISNYVMMECGQPLHVFDFSKIQDGKIVVRRGKDQEKMEAIDHSEYELNSEMCVIADPAGPVAIGGVMGGADSEISDTTTDVLIEVGHFNPLSVRNTARKLKLQSPSSYRFERKIDSAQLDWASRLCAELILQLAGGELCEGMLDVGKAPEAAAPITLRFDQLKRILGIEIPGSDATRILSALGNSIQSETSDSVTVQPPSWRLDLTREVDLIEEVGRIYGYDKIPDTVPVPMAASRKNDTDRVVSKLRGVLTASGFDEALTASLIPKPWSDAFSPWTDAEPLQISQPMLGVLEKASQNIGAVDLLRRSIVPSLLEVRRINEYAFNTDVDLFEIAKVYLPGEGELPREPWKIAIVSDRDYYAVKGVIEALLAAIHPATRLGVAELENELLDINHSAQLNVNDNVLGFLGEVSESARKTFGLRRRATIAELDLGVLIESAVMIRRHTDQSSFPPVTRDFNFVVDDQVRWADIESTVTEAGGEVLESVRYCETFRDEKKDGANKKRLLMSVVLRSAQDTLTGEQADRVCHEIVDRCQSAHGAALAK